MAFGSKSDHESYSSAAYSISPQLDGFCETILNMTPAELAHHVEAFAVGGARGVVQSSKKVHSQMKKECTSLLLRQLRKYRVTLSPRR